MKEQEKIGALRWELEVAKRTMEKARVKHEDALWSLGEARAESARVYDLYMVALDSLHWAEHEWEGLLQDEYAAEEERK